MNLSRSAPLPHPFAAAFARAIDEICAPLSPATDRVYRGTARSFLRYLLDRHPQLQRLQDLRRDPHVLGWLAHLRSRHPPLALTTYIARILLLRVTFQQLARSRNLPDLADLLRRQDVPRAPNRLPRPLTDAQDQAIQQELLRRNDLAANVLLLLRHTGMRIGEAADLSWDCLHSTAPGQWAIQVPLGKLRTERLVPVDSSVCALVQRLRFFRSFDPLPPDGRLLARTYSQHTLARRLRDAFHEVAAAAGIQGRVVPHQLRHTYATEMLRFGVTLPAVMKLLGHTSPDMTMLYLDVTMSDLRREYEQALSQPRHLIPAPRRPAPSPRSGADGIIDALLYAQHLIELFRRTLVDTALRRPFDRIANRLSKMLSLVRTLTRTAK
jgi:integrase